MRERLGYLHVPKVAGSSVVAAMREASPPTVRWCPHPLDTTLFGGFDRFDALAPEQRAAVFTGDAADLGAWDAVAGHFSLPHLLAAFDPADVAVLLREPRSRLLSHYTFWRGWSDPEHRAWAPYGHSRFAVELTWPVFLAEPLLAAQIDNLTVRLLVGDRPEVPPDGFIAPADLPALIAQAIDRLDELGHVDVIERGGACWRDLADWVELDLRIGRRNESTVALGDDWPAALTPAAAAALRDRVAGDRAVWDHVARRVGVGEPDALAAATWERHVARVAAAEAHHLRAELDRWETSTTARVTKPIRAVSARIGARLARRRD